MKRIIIRSAFFVMVATLSSLTWMGLPTTFAHDEYCGPGGCWIELNSTQLQQTVEVQTPRGDYNAVFQSEMHVFSNRQAQGFLLLRDDGAAPSPDDEVLVSFEYGDVRFNRDGTVAGVVLRGRTADGRPIVVMITPEASEDCLIYTTVGTDVHETWEVPGRLTVIRR